MTDELNPYSDICFELQLDIEFLRNLPDTFPLED